MSARTRSCARAPVSSSGVTSARATGAADAADEAAAAAPGTGVGDGGAAAGATGSGTTIGRSLPGGTAAMPGAAAAGGAARTIGAAVAGGSGGAAAAGSSGGAATHGRRTLNSPRRSPSSTYAMLSRSSSSASKSCGDAFAGTSPSLQARLHQVRELAQAHRAGHPRAALERVQRAPQLRGQAFVGRTATPVAHFLARLRKEFRGLVEEDGQHLRIDIVADVGERISHGHGQRDVVVRSVRRGFRQGLDPDCGGIRRLRVRRLHAGRDGLGADAGSGVTFTASSSSCATSAAAASASPASVAAS